MTQPDAEARRGILRRMGVATALMMASVLLSRVVGFLREIIIAGQQGATGQTDAYFAAFTLPDLLNYFLAGGTLSITFIPLFSAHLARGDEEGGWRLFSTVATGVGALVLAAVLAGQWLAPALVPLLNPGFDDPAQLALCVRMTRIVTPGMLCFAWGGLLQATLLSKEQFRWVAPIPIIYNLGIIAGGVGLGPWLGVEGFAWGALAGAVAGPLLLPLWASRHTLRYRPRLDLRSEGFRRYLALALPLMLGVSLVSMDEWLLKWFGSWLEAGTISWLNNARRLMLVPVAIIGQAASQAALPFLSRLWAEGRRAEMAEALTEGLRRVLFWAALAGGALGALAGPLVSVAFERGAFSARDAQGTAALLACFAAGVCAWSVQNLIARGYYALQNTWQPMLIGTAVVILSLPLYAALGDRWGAPGLALASSAGITLNALVMVLFFARRHAPLGLRALGACALRALASAGAGAGAAWLAATALPPLAAPLALALGAALYGAAALGVAALLRAPELDLLTGLAARVAARLRPRRAAASDERTR
jgi:putative peptidoglycan lipid II flippase